MPRQARLDTPGVLQHVMARGIERRKIFMDDQDRASFLERLALILEDTQTQCYAWTLIPNHFHILLRTGPPASPERERWRAGTIGILELWNDGIMPACRQTGVLKKMGQWFIGKILLKGELINGSFLLKPTLQYSTIPLFHV